MKIWLLAPGWLLLLIPISIVLFFRSPPSRAIWWLRTVIFLLVIFSLAEPVITMMGQEGMVIVVADRSRSMPSDSDNRHEETIRLLRAEMPERCRLAVVSFAESAVMELPPGNAPFQGFLQQMGRDGSELGEALEKALSLIPQNVPGRILLLSDGNWTGTDPVKAVHRAGRRRFPIDFRLYSRTGLLDLAFDRIDVPSLVQPGESFLVTCWIRSPIAQEIQFSAKRGSECLVDCLRHVPAGLSRIFFKDQAGEEGGVVHYSFQITASAADPIPENNTAQALVGIAGPRPVLVVTDHLASTFPQMINSPGLRIRVARPNDVIWNLDELANFCGVILDNVPAGRLGLNGLRNIGGWITETGGGLLMAGGKNSFGPGGYFRSSLDPLLPVSMELRSEQRKADMAIVVVMDRSGSMATSAGDGYTKMDLANLAAVEVLNLLPPNDEFGVIAVDSSPHVVVPIGPLTNSGILKNKILSIESEGGGIFIYEGLFAGVQMLQSAKAQTKHIILFADARDSEQPGQYRDLLEDCRKNGITVSVVGLGENTDCDASLLEDIAERGRGQVFFTPDPQELPRIFAQDTFVVSRSTFVEKSTHFVFTQDMQTLTSTMFEAPPSLGGYNLCYLRPGAVLGAVTADENKAPVIAAWQAGAGRVLVYTGELDGPFTGAIARWDKVKDFYSSLAKWVSGGAENSAWDMAVTRELIKDVCHIRLSLDMESNIIPFSITPNVVGLRARPGAKAASFSIPMNWIAPDLLTCDIPLVGEEVLLAVVRLSEHKILSVPPACLPYSPEFISDDGLKGAMTLENLAAATGGKERLELSGIWKDIPKGWVEVEIASWLLLLAAFLFLLEVLERRTGLISQFGGRLWNRLSYCRPRWSVWSHHESADNAIVAQSSVASAAGSVADGNGDNSLSDTELTDALKLAKGRAHHRSESR